MAQQTQQPPSKLLKVNQWVKRKYGVDGWWTCIQIDHAVMMFGSRVDSLLAEIDGKGKSKYKLDNLLKKPSASLQDKPVTQLSRNSGMVSPKPVEKRKKQTA